LTCQVTPVLLLLTVAENALVVPTCTLADVGSMLAATLGAGGVLPPPPLQALKASVSNAAASARLAHPIGFWRRPGLWCSRIDRKQTCPDPLRNAQ
jgi:hypothetical protein